MAGVGYVVSSKYRLVRLLGDGGMGSVYEAVHEVLGTHVALKLLHPELAGRKGLIDRFMQEAQVAAQIHSPHVVQVTDVDRTPEGMAYIVMELLQGEPLSSVLERERKLPIAVACEYTKQILEALEAAHALNVTHRDLKPENVFVTFAAGKPVLKLIDFGIAKLRNSELGMPKKLTVAGVVMGTADYMPPEQAISADQADARSDIYAVGVMLYEMMAGVRPVEGGDARIIAAKVEAGDVKPLVHAAPDVPRELAGLVHRAMAAKPELRFASATEMRIALDNVSLVPDGARIATKQLGQVGHAGQAGHAGQVGQGGHVGSIVPAALAQPAGPGTVLSAPADAVFAPTAAPHTGTVLGARMEIPPQQMAPPQLTPQAGAPFDARPPYPAAMQGPAPGRTPSPMYGSPPPRTRRGSGAAWLWLALPVLLGVGGVVAYFVVQSQDSPASPAQPDNPPLTNATTTPAATDTTAAQSPPPTGGNAVEPLTGPTTPGRAVSQVPPGHHPSAKPSSSPSPSASGGGATPFPSNPFPPITLPSGFPTLPSGFPQIPSGFPQLPSSLPSALPSGFPLPPMSPPPSPSGS